MLTVRIYPRTHWLAGLAALGVDAFFAIVLYHFWAVTPLFVRVFWILILASTVPTWVYQFSGEEIIEFDSQKLTVRKGIRGWERKREYQINECSNLQWHEGHKGNSYLGGRVGRWPIQFGKELSENNANKILTALQRTLPDVAQKICSFPGYREHFITLGLNKP